MNEKTKQKAIKVFNSCGVVIFPTDTAFGIGCRIDCTGTIKRVFDIRKRPLHQAVPVLIDSIDRAENIAQTINICALKLMKKHWPGGLTIIVKCKDKYIGQVTGGKNSIGLRIPDNQDLIDIIKFINSPIIAPSANLHGDPTPYKLGEVNSNLIKLVDLTINGTCRTNQASTVVDCTGNGYKIIRQGPVKP